MTTLFKTRRLSAKKGLSLHGGLACPVCEKPVKEFYTLTDLENWGGESVGSDLPIRLGVLGDPIEHSLSPQMHNAALESCGLGMRLARFAIGPKELGRALKLFASHHFVGISLTVPDKIAVLNFLDEVDENAWAIGAVNAVRFQGGRLYGYNTDGTGISDAIRSGIFGDASLSRWPVLLLGAGGASRAIARQCALEGCPKLFLSNRTRERAEKLGAEIAKVNEKTVIAVVDQEPEALRHALGEARLVINATNVGLRPDDRSLIARDSLNRDHFVYDTIYNPPHTALLAEAEAAGARFANGLTMLLHQGARSFELWFERKAPIEVMRAALNV
jgi:shikimate dehydrogenase